MLRSPRGRRPTRSVKNTFHTFIAHILFAVHKMSRVMSSRDKCGGGIRHASQPPSLHPRGTAQTGVLNFTCFWVLMTNSALLSSRTRRSCRRCIIKFHLTSFTAANVPVTRDVWGRNSGLFWTLPREYWVPLTIPPVQNGSKRDIGSDPSSFSDLLERFQTEGVGFQAHWKQIRSIVLQEPTSFWVTALHVRPVREFGVFLFVCSGEKRTVIQQKGGSN